MEKAKKMYREMVKEQDTRITRLDASMDQSDSDAWQSAFQLAPKTKREARQAAAALFGENGAAKPLKNVLMGKNQSCLYERKIGAGKGLIERDGRRQSLQGTLYGKTSQSHNKSHAFSKGGCRNVRTPLVSANFHHSMRRHLFNELYQLQKRDRDFLYLEITGTMKNGNGSVLSFLMNGKKKSIKKLDKPLTILSFFQNKSQLKYENPAVQQFCDMGWPVTRECIESVGHAVERLQERLKQHGWEQRAWR